MNLQSNLRACEEIKITHQDIMNDLVNVEQYADLHFLEKDR